MKTIFILLVFIFTTSGCTYRAVVTSTSAPVSEIMQSKKRPYVVSYYLDDALITNAIEIKPFTDQSSAHTFILEVGDSFDTAIKTILKNTSLQVTRLSALETRNIDENYKFTIIVETFKPRLHFESDFMEIVAMAESEIVMRVKVTDISGQEVAIATAIGTGTSVIKGDTSTGSQALVDATQIAIQRVLEDFIYKIINADYFTSQNPT